MMKILLAVDGSRYSDMSVKMLKALQLPADTGVVIMTVVPEQTFLGGIVIDAIRVTAAARKNARMSQEKKAMAVLQGPALALQECGFRVETLVCWGRPVEQIINNAKEMHIGLVVVGARGVSDSPRFSLGGVAHKVMKYATCSVLLVREGPSAIRQVFLATDGSKYSDEVARFLLDLPLPKQGQVTLLTALQSHATSLTKAPTLDLETDRHIMAELQATEEKAARTFLKKIKKRFEERGYEASLWVLRGEPTEEILIAARELNPDLIALGARGLSDVDTFLLGNVAERIARFSRYSVLIGRSPEEEKDG
jgi:nucleotide-binding universal stress UspA family protein